MATIASSRISLLAGRSGSSLFSGVFKNKCTKIQTNLGLWNFFVPFRPCLASPSNCSRISLSQQPSLPIKSSVMSSSSSVNSIGSQIWDSLGIWLIKRTFQPSIIRKRRKTGFLKRQKSVGGRRVLKRRLAKGRMRLGGCQFNLKTANDFQMRRTYVISQQKHNGFKSTC